jgi:cytochrome P450
MGTPQSQSDDPQREVSLVRLLEPDVLANPYPLYKRIQSEDPIHWDMYMQSWVLTRYKDVAFALKSFSAARTPLPEQLIEMGLPEFAPIAALTNKQMLFVDPPAHTRFRAAVAEAFAPASVRLLRRHVYEISSRLLESVLPRGEMDVVSEFADPLPAMVTARLLGVPEEDHLLLKGFAADFAETFGSFQQRADRTDAILASCREMASYFRKAIRQGQNAPMGSIIRLLVNEGGENRLSEDEAVANSIVIMVGGHETSASAIAGGIRLLLEHPDQLLRLRVNPELAGPAAEEVLRYESPVQHTARVAVADTNVEGRQICAGQSVIALIAAANRDPSVFEYPDRFNVDRSNNRNLAFGWGQHHCLGAVVARMETQIALKILSQLPHIHLKTAHYFWQNHLGLRSLRSLRIGFDACSPAVLDDLTLD